MKIQIDTKFKPGQNVFFVEGDIFGLGASVMHAKIISIELTITNDECVIMYHAKSKYNNITKLERYFYSTNDLFEMWGKYDN